MEGPQFSSLAESQLYRSWKADVIGMTNMPEAKLAREAEIRYASISMVTDYDCWHPDHENVDVQQVIKVLLENASKAKEMIKDIIENYTKYVDDKDPATKCLDIAIITDPKKRTKKTPRIHFGPRLRPSIFVQLPASGCDVWRPAGAFFCSSASDARAFAFCCSASSARAFAFRSRRGGAVRS